MRQLRILLKALSRAWQRDTQAAPQVRQYAGAVDIYEIERRIDEQARLRMALYAADVGR